jgi:hypothetical protein
LSAQHQARSFWGNIPGLERAVIPAISIKLDECLMQGMRRKVLVEKIRTLTMQSNFLHQGG